MQLKNTICALFLLLAIPCTLAFITWIEPRHPLPGIRPALATPWPLPQKWEKSSKLMLLEQSKFLIKTSCPILTTAAQRYRPHIFSDVIKNQTWDPPKIPTLKTLEINVVGFCEDYPQQGSKENYHIDIDESMETAKLDADTVWGALRGLETFSQLVYQNDNGHYIINATKITDFPRFTYRGLLLDTGRHYIPVSDAMEWNKLNVFHWHLVDDQSFPFESKVYPNLTILGAYSPKHVYTQKVIKDVIEYARLRGIRVIPEIDSPGHTHALGKAFPDIITPCYGDKKTPFTPNYTEFSAAEILNPMKEKTFTVMKTILEEVKTVFKDEYIHLGMDEVYYGCWRSNPDIEQFMQKKGFAKISQVEQYYTQRLIKDVADIGYKYMAWQDPIENGFQPDTIVHVWKDTELDFKMDKWHEYIKLVASKNYQIVLSACWYLNYISYGPDWKKYYECDPQNFEGTAQQKNLVIGGQAALWMEYADGTNLLSRLWPRASAVAERLWSDKSVNDTNSAAFRLDQQRCRMLKRGIQASPILNGFCGDYEWEMDQTL
uniref:Beta-hexosaminidase n=1 Tax=Strigamia maritima TaxID=126957 RepID=T1IVE0_STRMM